MKDGRDWCDWYTDSPETRKRVFGKGGSEGDQNNPNDPENMKRLNREKYNISEGAKGDNPITTAPETSERMEAYRKDAANIEKNRIWKSEIEKMNRKSDLEKRRKIEK